MSKELTPLKALKELKKRYGKKFSLNDDERCRIIETELNRIPNLEKALRLEIENSAKLNNERIKDLKKVQALEIIKTKQVNVAYFNLCLCLKDYNKYCLQQRELTKEEYELLKEILK